jgi:lipopolysaccharide export LptBFGC system permease protein LptF
MEANRRIISSLFILVYSLIACSILLMGQNQRQKRWRKPVFIVAFCLTVHISLLSLLNSLGKNPYAILICYTVLFLLGFASFILILRPQILVKKPEKLLLLTS